MTAGQQRVFNRVAVVFRERGLNPKIAALILRNIELEIEARGTALQVGAVLGASAPTRPIVGLLQRSIMNSTEDKKIKIDPVKVVMEKIKQVATSATSADRALVGKILASAKEGLRFVAMYSLTPAACALLFMDENGHNRDFDPACAERYARLMKDGFWKKNNASIGFYADGEIADGQHRLSGAALAGYTLDDYVVVAGLDRDCIDTVDAGKLRDGASSAKLDGILDAPAKQAVVKAYAAYMVRAGEPSCKLETPTEIKRAIEAHDPMLDASLRIGAESIKNIVSPVCKAPQAAALAFIMLRGNWPEQRVREKLALFNQGKGSDENSLFLRAGQIIEKAREAREARQRLSNVKELGVVIYAMVETERGNTVITGSGKIRKEVEGKTVPSPYYPLAPIRSAA